MTILQGGCAVDEEMNSMHYFFAAASFMDSNDIHFSFWWIQQEKAPTQKLPPEQTRISMMVCVQNQGHVLNIGAG